MRWMRSVSGNIRFVRSYLLPSFGHVQNFKLTPPDRRLVDKHFLCVSMRVVRFSCIMHPVGTLYVSVNVRSTRVVEQSTSRYVMVKMDQYRMLNGQEHIKLSNNGCEKVVHEIKTMMFIFLYFHFHCKSLKEPLHLRCFSQLHERIFLSHTNTHAAWADQRQPHPITLFVYWRLSDVEGVSSWR